MAPRALHARFAEKASVALTTAIETYNKPTHEYREETFAILAINGWELLLKARVLQLNDNDIRSIYVYYTKKTKKGVQSKKRYVDRNTSGTAKTISLYKSLSILQSSAKSTLPDPVKSNLLALSEVRDNASHFITASSILRAQVMAISLASVKNFILLAKEWFDVDLADRISLVLPLAFLAPAAKVESVVVNSEEGRLIDYLRELAQTAESEESPYDVAVKVDIRLKRSNLQSATKVQVVNDPNATAVVLTEENILELYPWNYKALCKLLADRYSDFTINAKFHTLRESMSGDTKYAWNRLFDPTNPKSGRKRFFSQAVLSQFDKHYSKKQ